MISIELCVLMNKVFYKKERYAFVYPCFEFNELVDMMNFVWKNKRKEIENDRKLQIIKVKEILKHREKKT